MIIKLYFLGKSGWPGRKESRTKGTYISRQNGRQLERENIETIGLGAQGTDMINKKKERV